MATIREINLSLPRLDTIRRHYMRHGMTGIAYGYGFLVSAYADLDEQNECTDIRLYVVGEAKERRHYYSDAYDRVVNITDIIEQVILPDDAPLTRADVCRMIRDRIAETLNA